MKKSCPHINTIPKFCAIISNFSKKIWLVFSKWWDRRIDRNFPTKVSEELDWSVYESWQFQLKMSVTEEYLRNDLKFAQLWAVEKVRDAVVQLRLRNFFGQRHLLWRKFPDCVGRNWRAESRFEACVVNPFKCLMKCVFTVNWIISIILNETWD